MISLFSKHAFSFWLFVAAGLAIAFPGWAESKNVLWFEWATKLGVIVIFFLQGVSLPTRLLAKGWKPVRLHLFVLSWNYLWFPAVTGLLLILFSRFQLPELSTGFLLLSILPTTVASATAFTSVSGGATANAIFSTVLSNLLAVFIVPAVSMVYFATESAGEISLFGLWIDVFTLLIVPLLVGQVVQLRLTMDARFVAKVTRQTSSIIIVLIVYISFLVGMNSGSFEKLSFVAMSLVLAGVALLLFLTCILIWKSVYFMRLNVPQTIAAFFCASQKSLASGLPLISSVFVMGSDMADASIVLIPLLCYHSMQILFAGIVANWLVKKDFSDKQKIR